MTIEDAQMVPAPLGPVERLLGAWWKKLTHKHAYRQRKNWGILDGQLVCLRTTQCDECGHKMEQALLLIATADELAEANSKRIESDKAPNVGIEPPERSARMTG